MDRRTTEEWESLLGAQFRAARIQAELEQSSLARLANVSEGAVKSLEAGKGSSLKTMIKIVRALERTDWLSAFAPPVSVSPLQVLKGQSHPRQRVSRSRKNA
jgi:DNA-binding XRE family transcriptional regulator